MVVFSSLTFTPDSVHAAVAPAPAGPLPCLSTSLPLLQAAFPPARHLSKEGSACPRLPSDCADTVSQTHKAAGAQACQMPSFLSFSNLDRERRQMYPLF